MNDSKLVVTEYHEYLTCFKFEGSVLSELFLDRNKDIKVNDIYIGRISNVKDDLHAYFVEFQKGIIGYLPFSETDKIKYKQGDLIPVQVTSELIKTKSYSLTKKLSLSLIASVLTTDDNQIHVSSKINKDKSKELLSHFEKINHKYGIILRTNSLHYSYEFLEDEILKGEKVLDKILAEAPYRNAFYKLYEGKSSLFQRINSLPSDSYSEIITDEASLYNELNVLRNVRLYKDESLPLKALYSFDKAFSLATERKVNLKSGGYLIIEPTEALTVIDVNSGCITNKKSKEENTKTINTEACIEAARQIRLRNLSGIIIIDFINTSSEEDKEYLISLMKKELKKDILKATVIDITKLGLMEITREKKYETIYDFLSGNN